MADFRKRLGVTKTPKKISGYIKDSNGTGVPRSFLVLSITKDTSKTNIRQTKSYEVGRGESLANGSFNVLIRPKVFQRSGESGLLDDFHGIAILVLGDETANEKSVVYDQITPVAV